MDFFIKDLVHYKLQVEPRSPLSLSLSSLSLSIYIYENVYRLFPLPEVLRENPVKLKSGASLLVSSSLLLQTRLKHNQMCHRRFLMTHTNAHS